MGNGNSINFWYDNWMDEPPIINKSRPNTKDFINNQTKVNEFITTTKKYNLQKS